MAFRSKTEAAYNAILYYRIKAGEIKSFLYEPKPPLILHSIGRGRTYQPDFLVCPIEGQPWYVEVKGGFIREDAMLKFEWAALVNPDKEFIMIQYKDRIWSTVKHIKAGVDITPKKPRGTKHGKLKESGNSSVKRAKNGYRKVR